jgi:uncharacterized membrane protein
MATVDSSIEVNVPVQTAYNQWTQFEEFPRFMEGVRQVQQMGDERLYWQAELGGEMKEWYAVITRQVPDQVIAWESEGGTRNDGTVVFKPLGADRTEIELHINYEPEGMKEEVGSAIGAVSRRVKGDLDRFKEYIETRGLETGGWRGEIQHGESREPGSSGMGTSPTRDPGMTERDTMPGRDTIPGREPGESAPGSGERPL